MVAMATAAAADIAYDDHPTLIGADINTPPQLAFFQGDLDEVRLWKSPRSDAMIAADMHSCQSNDDLAGYWPFDEGSGAITADLSGNNNTATLGPTTAIEPADPAWIASDVPF